MIVVTKIKNLKRTIKELLRKIQDKEVKMLPNIIDNKADQYIYH